ncbi:MAG TPA: GxxExxY protein [Candidatus Thermoplasmatota archaeon]|nr:GxxExxY protein [Candidatus Thermoplasmatota archaeon]
MTASPPKRPTPQEELDDARTYAIIGAAIEVHRTLGSGFVERVYHLALGAEFRRRGILHDPKPSIPVWYQGEAVGIHRPHYVCLDAVLVELRAQPALTPADSAQVQGVLQAARLDVGLLLNFGTPILEKRRLARPWVKAPSGVPVWPTPGVTAHPTPIAPPP